MKPSYIIATVLIGIGIWLSGDSVSPSPKVDYEVPSKEMKVIVEPIKAFRGKKNADVAAQFYAAFAEVLDRDGITTNSQLREAHKRANELDIKGTDVAGSLPGLSAKIDEAIMKSLGKEDTQINKAKAVETFKAIAWALGGSGE